MTARLAAVPRVRPAAAGRGRRDERRRLREARQRARHDTRVRARQKRLRTGLWHHVWRGDVPTLLTSPIIYSVAVPLLLLDAWVSLYQAICFRAWDITRVRRRPYFALDHHRLAYLNSVEKLNCLFCSYANGLIAYVGEVAARTEQYWCPIRHARRTRNPHQRAAAFAAYGDALAYRDGLPQFRQALRNRR